MIQLNGSVVAIITPFLKKSKLIDYQKFEALIDWHITQKSNGIVVAGSTGESASLNLKEWIKLLEIAKQVSNNRIPIIAGTGTNDTRTSIKKTLLAEKIGVDAALIVTPYYNKPTQHGLKLHFTKIATKTKIPIILYNVPSRTGCDLLPQTVKDLSFLDNIIGIKEATGNLNRVTELKNQCKENFILLSGDDASFLEFMLQGGAGIISVTANVLPETISKICNLLLMHNNLFNISSAIEQAKKFNQHLLKLHKILMVESNPIPVKWLLGYLNKINPTCRLPLTTLSKKYHKELILTYEEALININNLNIITKEATCNI